MHPWDLFNKKMVIWLVKNNISGLLVRTGPGEARLSILNFNLKKHILIAYFVLKIIWLLLITIQNNNNIP